MKKSIKYIKYLASVLMLLIMVSCGPDPSMEVLENWYVSFENQDGARIFPGEDIKAVLWVSNDKDSFTGVKVTFEIVKGGGVLSAYESQPDSNGRVETTWTPGTESAESILRAHVFDEEGEHILSKELLARTFIMDAWNTVSEEPDGRIMDLVADTINDFTIMVTNNSLYRQGERYYMWDRISHSNLDQPRTIEIDNNGILYVSTWKGEVVKSSDHGINWTNCTRPYPENQYFIDIWVSGDNSIWVYKHQYPVRVSRDGGQTWITIPQNLSEYGFGRVYRLTNGTLIFHGSNCCALNVSYDDGRSWTHITSPGYSTRVYVDGNDRIFLITQENGITLYSFDLEETEFTRIHSVYPQWGSTWENNHFLRWKNFWYVVIPGAGILKSFDLVHFENYWYNPDLLDLFIDHNGVLIAKDWDWRTVYYRQNTDN